MKRLWTAPCQGVVLFALLLFLSSAPLLADELAARDGLRLLRGFAEDGTVADMGWVSLAMVFSSWEDFAMGESAEVEWESFRFGPVIEYTVVEHLGVGTRMQLAYNCIEGVDDRRNLVSAFGLVDWDLWVKYRVFLAERFQLAPGILMNIPTGGERVPLSNGFDFELFGSLRYDHPFVTMTGHLGLRINSDFVFEFKGDDNRHAAQVDGHPSFKLGLGAICPVHDMLSAVAEFHYETSRIEEGDDFIQFVVGLDLHVREYIPIRAYSAGGVKAGAPELEVGFEIAYLF